MSSSTFCLSISSLLLLLLLIYSSDAQSTPRTFTPNPNAAAPTARAMNRVRRNKQTAEFLAAHNEARLGSGASTLIWDKGLARFATNWAKLRKSDCKMTHSTGPYGENIFWYQKSQNWSPRRVVTNWMAESLNYDRVTNTCKPGKMCGHYTQIVWRTTTAVGCAKIKCNYGLGFLVVCEYSPTGNYEGESPFNSQK